MKIGFVSDVHIDINADYDLVSLITENIIENNIDVLVIAGDISESYNSTIDFVDKLTEKSGVKIYFVPGNHDMWSEEQNTPEIYENFAKHGACLIGKTIDLTENLSLIGDIGWYDYSFGSKEFTQQDFKKKNYAERTWQDSLNIDWKKSDKEIARFFCDNLAEKLEKLKDKNVIVATHFLSHEKFLVPVEREVWRYFNAFLGSEMYKELMEKYRVKYAVMGHVHFRHSFTENGTNYICACLNYHKEWRSDDVKNEINSAIKIIEVT